MPKCRNLPSIQKKLHVIMQSFVLIWDLRDNLKADFQMTLTQQKIGKDF